MNKDYITYLVSILFIIAAILFIYIVTKKRNKKSVEEKVEEVCGGSISIFLDMQNNICIIPYKKDKFGRGNAIKEIQYLNFPYEKSKLGEIIRHAMALCDTGIQCLQGELIKILKCKSWKDFAKERKSVSVHYKDQKIYINSTAKNIDGMYYFNNPKLAKILDCDASNIKLGNAVIEAFNQCK